MDCQNTSALLFIMQLLCEQLYIYMFGAGGIPYGNSLLLVIVCIGSSIYSNLKPVENWNECGYILNINNKC